MSSANALICFQLSHQQQPLALCHDTGALTGWRRVLRKLGVLGQRPDRYNGASFGNLSCRHPEHSERFLITADETGHLGTIGVEQLSEVLKADFSQQTLQSRGIKPPSDQSLSHQQLYQRFPNACAICHFHLPELWLQPELLGIASISEAELDTADLRSDNSSLLVHLRDHPDGFLCIADNLDSLGARISALLAAFWRAH